jgi:hypothetical protein
MIKGQILVSDMTRTPTARIIKDGIPVSDLSRTPTVSIIKPRYQSVT